MPFLLRSLLLPASLIQAAWLRLRGRPAPDFGNVDQWRGRFRLAVWLAVFLLPAAAQQAEPPVVMCYDMMPPKETPLRPLSRVRLMWMALDPKQSQALATALTASVRTGEVEVRVSNLLLRIHKVLADHQDRTRVQRITCYRMTEVGARMMGHREAALAQLEALAKVRKAGRVAPDVLASAEPTRLGASPGRKGCPGGGPDPHHLVRRIG
jgi:hypothetical protein